MARADDGSLYRLLAPAVQPRRPGYPYRPPHHASAGHGIAPATAR